MTRVLSDPVILLGVYQKEIISNVENRSNTIYAEMLITVLSVIMRNLKQPVFQQRGDDSSIQQLRPPPSVWYVTVSVDGRPKHRRFTLPTIFEVGILTPIPSPYKSGNRGSESLSLAQVCKQPPCRLKSRAVQTACDPV